MNVHPKCPRVLGILLFAAAANLAIGAEELPQTTPDGLQLLSDTELRAVYVTPGATLDQYTKVNLLDCYVAFRKNWDRDYNRNVSLQGRVQPDDMEKIKARVAEEFKVVFTEELQTKGGYEIVDHTGDEVLVVRPAIINLEVNAPDVASASMTRTYVTSAGSMTLFMELYDSVTGDIIARVLDPQTDRGSFAMSANRMTNKAEADRILRKWADILRNHMGDIKDATGLPEAQDE